VKGLSRQCVLDEVDDLVDVEGDINPQAEFVGLEWLQRGVLGLKERWRHELVVTRENALAYDVKWSVEFHEKCARRILAKYIAVFALECGTGSHGTAIRRCLVAKFAAYRVQPRQSVVVVEGRPRSHLVYVTGAVQFV
jgi:hypothetical protein